MAIMKEVILIFGDTRPQDEWVEEMLLQLIEDWYDNIHLTPIKYIFII